MNATRFILDSNHVKPVNHLQGLNTHNTEEFLRLRRRLQTLGSLPHPDLCHTSVDNYLDIRACHSAPAAALQQVVARVVAPLLQSGR